MIFKLSMTGLKSRLKDYLVLFSGLSAAQHDLLHVLDSGC